MTQDWAPGRAAEPAPPVWEAGDWLQRAAVLSVFDVGWLRLGDASDTLVTDFLIATCERVVDPAGVPRWRLRDDERGRVLRTAPRASLRAALDSAPARPDDEVQDALARFVAGDLVPIADLNVAQLRSELQLQGWVGPGAGRPTSAELRARLDWLAVTEPLDRLAHGFVGRETLLAECREFIDRPGPARVPILIEGIGGSGKSSLISRLITKLPDENDLAVYLSFDRGWLLDGGPPALFDEVLRQVGAQRPDFRDSAADVRRRARLQAAQSAQKLDIASRRARLVGRVDPGLIADLGRITATARRIVVVLDTLEELARRDEVLSAEIYRFLDGLMAAVPSVRVIGGGRVAPWDSARIREITGSGDTELLPRRLVGLDEPDALTLLQTLTSGESDSTLREVIALVRGHPLSLRLAAEVLNRTGTNPAQLIAVSDGDVQGQLYSRLLDHISDARARAVAHPGLVIRRITPDIILTVLAEPCGIAPLDLAAARNVFEALRDEATLCVSSPEGDGALVHREDVRAIMLPAITRDRPGTARAIHEAAVQYYASAVSDLVARREELYHRLMLGQDRDTLNSRWEQALATDLTTEAAFGEYPASSQLYLAAKVPDLDVGEAVAAGADDYDWQQVTRPAAIRLLERGQVREALKVVQAKRGADGSRQPWAVFMRWLLRLLRRRPGRPLLPDLEIEALERLRRFRKALALIRSERERAATDRDPVRLRELIVQEARILERERRWSRAWALLAGLGDTDRERRAHAAAKRAQVDNDVRVQDLVVLTSMLRIARHERSRRERLRLLVRHPRQFRSPPDRHVDQLTRETVAVALATPRRVLRANTGLLRDLAAEIGDASPEILGLATTVFTGDGTDGGTVASAASGSTGFGYGIAAVVRAIFSWSTAALKRPRSRAAELTSVEGYQRASAAAQLYGRGLQLLAVGLLVAIVVFVVGFWAALALPPLSGPQVQWVVCLLDIAMVSLAIGAIGVGGVIEVAHPDWTRLQWGDLPIVFAAWLALIVGNGAFFWWLVSSDVGGFTRWLFLMGTLLFIAVGGCLAWFPVPGPARQGLPPRRALLWPHNRSTAVLDEVPTAMLRSLLGVGIGVVAAIAYLGVTAWYHNAEVPAGPALPAAPAGIHGGYLALGDSFSAGEGLFPYAPGTTATRCDRSANAAYPTLLARLLKIREFTFAACSGAVVGDLLHPVSRYGTVVPAQVTVNSTGQVGLITLTIGASDAMFGPIVASCLQGASCLQATFPPGGIATGAAMRVPPGPLFTQWAPRTVAAIGNEEAALFAVLRHDFPVARIVVIGYPYLFPASPAPGFPYYPPDCESLLNRFGVAEREELRNLQDELNDRTYEEAAAAGIEFVSPYAIWGGHEPCGAEAPYTQSVQPYLNFANPVIGGDFHPNAAGQQALAALVACYLDANPAPPDPYLPEGQHARAAPPADQLVTPAELGLASPPGEQAVPGQGIIPHC